MRFRLFVRIVRQITKVIRLAFCLLVLSSAGFAWAEDWDARLDRQSRECLLVVVGRVTKIVSTSHPYGKTSSVAIIEVRRHLKGISDVKTMEAEFRFESSLDMKLDDGDAIWFIREKLDNGRYLVADWKWGQDSLYRILSALNRTDKQTRIPGMPKPVPGPSPLSLSLAADDGQGNALITRKCASLQDVTLLVQFENRGNAPRSVMPCLDGSEDRRRYPYYDLEILDADGKPIPRQGIGFCGNIDPLRARDIVSLQPGEVFRTWAPWSLHNLPSGKYRIRLHYTAKQNTATNGIPLGQDDKEAKELIKAVWEGDLHSNWIDVEVVP
jgi:hypothetical protein